MPTTGLTPRLYDAGALALALLGVYLVLWPERPVLPEEAPAWWWIDLVGGVVAALVLLARRRAPVASALVVYGLTVLCTSAWLAGAVATFSLAVRRPWPTAAALGAFSLVIGPVQGLFRLQTEESTSWGNLAWVVAITVALLATGAAIRARHELLDSLIERAERAETEAALRAEAARSAERTRIVREMHDVLAHRLSMVSLHAGALAHRRSASPDEVREALEVVRAGARDALVDLRTILGVLRDPDADGPEGGVDSAAHPPQPTLADLGRLLDGVRSAGTPVTLRDELAGAALPDEAGRTLYRITQEALTNAARHAPGQPVEVVLRGAPGADAELEVTNPLPAVVTAGAPGNGLLGIAERVDLAGGRVLARGPENHHFRVAVRVPWPAAGPRGAPR
ncbi:sensor histidine kinase [Actinomycetospora cinnamomea]|uniref:histidine kinase n=1 Tax=Actinomycetospora cinnamomea TaxID=663609 RepID=A0A2U1FQ85_9PSEU|nr:histidine kinase [Actinomycetospora cinnamomea]PVZ14355.1 signal transduction histidine kinase [Actinomycetospora cinnamomea]